MKFQANEFLYEWECLVEMGTPWPVFNRCINVVHANRCSNENCTYLNCIIKNFNLIADQSLRKKCNCVMCHHFKKRGGNPCATFAWSKESLKMVTEWKLMLNHGLNFNPEDTECTYVERWINCKEVLIEGTVPATDSMEKRDYCVVLHPDNEHLADRDLLLGKNS